MTASRIAYDLPVRNLIAELDATNHVTHTQHRKTHVTLHHNGGWLSHDGILNVWRTREASAHFNIDDAGTAAQFVGVAEYAWACGNTEGNQRSISIEHCNVAGAPSWAVAEITWQRGARLAGWLFARVIGTRPTSDTLVFHKRWSATECAGPWMARVYPTILAIAQETYDRIVRGEQEHEVELTDSIELYDHDTGGLKTYQLKEAFQGIHRHAKQANLAADRLEIAVARLEATLSDDEASLLAAIRAQPTGGEVGPEDVQLLAEQLDVILPPSFVRALGVKLTEIHAG